ncbi:hypothetical protein DKN91_02495 [Escherichia coli]|nr:hypothetical protein [Escherichia coli]EFO1763952.1 hypothetical protein [Escherichia coli]EFO1924047.1 hypothetical protein [Escherichia coli]EFO1944436.1 hypothetical protein [Escherichia coli]EFO1949904.1 hypothetical protein [Escherichia coli]
MDCPGPTFAGNHNPGRYGRVFPSFGCFFSVFCWLDSSEKMLARPSFHRKRYLKGIIKWYCHRVPYITCHEGIKR